jgi:hypothetical protein
MGSREALRIFLVGVMSVIGCGLSMAADADDQGGLLNVEFPHDSPVLPVHFGLQEPGPTTAFVRGTSLVVNLHASLLLRNTGSKTISGLTIMVQSPDLTPVGRGSVSVPSLHAQPGAIFPVRVDMQLSRPLSMGRAKGAMMQLSLDCALFSDLSAYGPDQLGSKRMLMVYELESRRDRRYLADLLETGQTAALRAELNFGLVDLNPAQLSLELLRQPVPRAGREQPVKVGAVAFPSAPIKPIGGNAQVIGDEVRASEVEVKNTSDKPIKVFQVGWIVRDQRGRDFIAGSIPSSTKLAPVATASLTQPGALRLSHPGGQEMVVGGLLAFVNNVEFADGKFWIPTRIDITEATADPILRRALASSPEQQRLAEIYRRKGMAGLQQDLRRPD